WKVRNGEPFYKIQKFKIGDRFFKIPIYTTNQFQTGGLLILSILIKIFPSFIKKFFLKKISFLNILKKFDLILDLSEGDSFTDLYGIKRMLVYGFVKIIPINLGISVIMLPQTVGPFRLLPSKILAKWILNRVEKICVREPESKKIILEIINKKDKLISSFDLGFLLSAKKIKNSSLFAKLRWAPSAVGINISGLIYDNNQRKKILKKNFNYSELIKDIIVKLINISPNSTIFLVPHVYSVNKGIKYDDLAATFKIYNNLPDNIKEKIFILEKNYSCSELKWFIGNLSFFVGTRMHSCISAISSCVPTVFISYSHKSLGIIENLGLKECALDMKLLNEEQILKRISDIFEKKDFIKKKLIRVIPQTKENILKICNTF
ncbi:polysaccharide pyruvyl transferase family protein, partial [Patescibacteria group bacterium]